MINALWRAVKKEQAEKQLKEFRDRLPAAVRRAFFNTSWVKEIHVEDEH